MTDSPEQRFFDAAAVWVDEGSVGNQELIDAATRAMVEGLDSTSLVMLASERATIDTQDLREVLNAALDELRIPRPGTIDQWTAIGPGGRTFPRPPTDVIHVEVRRLPMHAPEVQVLIWVNGQEITSVVGPGVHPFDMFISGNDLEATDEPQRTMIAGDEWEWDEQVVIARDGNTVKWGWDENAMMPHGFVFDAAQYDAEIARAGADHSWEQPEETAARLIMEGTDYKTLARYHLSTGVPGLSPEPGEFDLHLYESVPGYGPGYEIRVPVAWGDPEDVARRALDLLSTGPRTWRAFWSCTDPRRTAPPPLAGPRWIREPAP
ncbi:MAG: hypothetical protein L0K74_10495 [Acidipropionibacterium acidipropionici]|nr:hypothetical protein [Acidipropionibacterium acidipropionici]